MNEILEIENLVKRFGKNYAVKNVSFSVNEGEILAIIGSSGSGKSTVLRCINQLEKIDGGNIKICGEPMIKKIKQIINYLKNTIKRTTKLYMQIKKL